MKLRTLVACTAFVLAVPAFAQDASRVPSDPDNQQNPASGMASEASNPSDRDSYAQPTPAARKVHHRHRRSSSPTGQSPGMQDDGNGNPDTSGAGNGTSGVNNGGTTGATQGGEVNNSAAYNANTSRMTGTEPGVASYQRSNRSKRYPAVDRAHVAGDPPVIDHSADQAPVDNPTHTSIAVPPQQAP